MDDYKFKIEIYLASTDKEQLIFIRLTYRNNEKTLFLSMQINVIMLLEVLRYKFRALTIYISLIAQLKRFKWLTVHDNIPILTKYNVHKNLVPTLDKIPPSRSYSFVLSFTLFNYQR